MTACIRATPASLMAAKMIEAGKDVTYYENIEGGHGGAANSPQAAHMSALVYSFLWGTTPISRTVLKELQLDRPGFHRHLRAIINGSERGVYGKQAVHG